MDALLEYCCEEKPFIATKFSPDDESSIRGVLQEAGDVLIIQRYFNAGIKDALVYLNKEDIKILSIDTCQEQNVCLLSQITEE